MNALKRYWKPYAEKIDAMSLRERTLLFLVAAGILLFAVLTFAIDPLFTRQKMLSKTLENEQTKIAAIQKNLQGLAAGQAMDPDAADKKRLARLNQQLLDLNLAFNTLERTLVPPDRMATVLRDILADKPNVQLLALKTLPAAQLADEVKAGTVSASSTAAGQKASAGIYKHGVEVTVQGNYGDLLDYVATLEKLPWRMFWSHATMRADAPPLVQLTLTVYTLSLDKTWLSV